jgi:hypothetical protein
MMGVRKAMGLKKGEKVKRLHAIEVVAVSREPLWKIGLRPEDIKAEGFNCGAWAFIRFFAKTHKCKASTRITRIQFRHL